MADGDHLNYIRITGLEADAEECFQGLAAGSSSGGGGTSPGGTTNLEWGDIPAEAVTMLQQYTQDLNTWFAAARAYDPDAAARGLPAPLEVLPALPVLAGTVATGGATLPAVATVMLSQAVLNFVGTAVESFAESLDENSPRNLFKKAFLYDADGETRSILKQALLYALEIEGNEEIRSVVKDGLEDLSFVDAELKYADNVSLHVKGKVLNY